MAWSKCIHTFSPFNSLIFEINIIIGVSLLLTISPLINKNSKSRPCFFCNHGLPQLALTWRNIQEPLFRERFCDAGSLGTWIFIYKQIRHTWAIEREWKTRFFIRTLLEWFWELRSAQRPRHQLTLVESINVGCVGAPRVICDTLTDQHVVRHQNSII